MQIQLSLWRCTLLISFWSQALDRVEYIIKDLVFAFLKLIGFQIWKEWGAVVRRWAITWKGLFFPSLLIPVILGGRVWKIDFSFILLFFPCPLFWEFCLQYGFWNRGDRSLSVGSHRWLLRHGRVLLAILFYSYGTAHFCESRFSSLFFCWDVHLNW